MPFSVDVLLDDKLRICGKVTRNLVKHANALCYANDPTRNLVLWPSISMSRRTEWFIYIELNLSSQSDTFTSSDQSELDVEIDVKYKENEIKKLAKELSQWASDKFDENIEWGEVMRVFSVEID